MDDFYVYMYLDLENIPFYIGKGCGKRFRVCNHLQGVNKYLINKIHKIGRENIKIWKSGPLSEEDAFYAEAYYILIFGRKNDKDFSGGTLYNLTDGGEGEKHTEETKRKISISNKGKPSLFKGRKHTDEAKQKVSSANKGNKYCKGCIRSAETNKKNRDAHRGLCHSEESKKKTSRALSGNKNPMFGKTHSIEVCQKISETHLGKPSPRKGQHLLKEIRIKISNTLKEYHRIKKEKINAENNI